MRDIIKAIGSGSRFVIACHVNPDGDALGSSLALAGALKEMGKQVDVFSHDGVPALIGFLPGTESVLDELPSDSSDAVLILLDCNGLERAGIPDAVFRSSIVIDHHATATPFGDLRWVEPETAATGLMVYRMLLEMGVHMTPDIATNLYAAIAIDTGTFRFPNTTADVLEAGAALVRAGADPSVVADKLYQSWSHDRFLLFSLVLAGLEISKPLAILSVTMQMHEQTGTTVDDTETFVNFPLIMDDVKVSVLMKQREGDLWRVSLRSKGDVDVSAVAASFGGGGHHNAAGCSIEGPMDEAKARIMKALKGVL